MFGVFFYCYLSINDYRRMPFTWHTCLIHQLSPGANGCLPLFCNLAQLFFVLVFFWCMFVCVCVCEREWVYIAIRKLWFHSIEVCNIFLGRPIRSKLDLPNIILNAISDICYHYHSSISKPTASPNECRVFLFFFVVYAAAPIEWLTNKTKRNSITEMEFLSRITRNKKKIVWKMKTIVSH